MTDINLLVVDDHELFRTGLELLIAQNFPAARVFACSGIGQAIDGAPGKPDLILLDYNLAGVSGQAAIALVQSYWPQAQLIVVTAEQDSEVLGAITALEGVRLLPKSAPLATFAALIGECLPQLSRGTGEQLLSSRQIEILRHMREGHSNKAIARLVGLSEFTVRGHVQRILKLTGASNRTNAVFLAEQAGFLGPQHPSRMALDQG